MAIPVIDPQNGDDLTAQSITVNVTDKIVAWAGSHEAGLLTNSALRHTSDQIDDAALPETTTPVSTGLLGIVAGGQHARNDMFAVTISALAGGGATGYAAKVAALGALTYGNLTAVNTELGTNATPTATASRLVRRRVDGSADFAATSTFVNVVATGTVAASGNVSGANVTASGLLIAGSGARAVTIADGHLDATQLSGLIPGASLPAFSGDVTNVAAAMTVASVGGKTASAIATVVTAIQAAASTGVGNHGVNAKFDGSGGMTFDAAVTAPSFVGTLSGSATGVPAAGITGTVMASQIDSAIARVSAVPTNGGVGATGTWPISITGSATTVAAGAIGTTQLAAGAVTNAILATASVGIANILDGAIVPYAPGTLHVYVNPIRKWNQTWNAIHWDGGDLDLTTHIPGAGTNRYVLIAVNGALTPTVYAKDGGPTVSALTDSDRPTPDPNTTPLGFVALSAGQTQILASHIQMWRGPGDAGPGGTGTSGSQIGHVHGQSGESRVGAIGLDEGFSHPTASPSLSFLIEPQHYQNTARVTLLKGQVTIGPISNPGSGYRIVGYYLDPATGSYIATSNSDDPLNDATHPAYPAFSGSQIPTVYLHTQAGATLVKAGADGTNAWLEDARTWGKGGAGVSSIPVAVSEGGTGVITMSTGIVVAPSPGGTTPLTTIATTSSTVIGVGILPSVTGMTAASTVANIQLGGGNIVNGATALARIIGTEAVPPVKTGAGVATDSVAFMADLPANGTNNASALFAGSVRVGSTVMPTKTLDLTGTFGVSGASTLAGLTATTGSFSSTLAATGAITGSSTIAAVTGITITSAGEVGSSGNSLFVTGTAADIGTSISNTGTSGRHYAVMSTNSGSGLTLGALIFYDFTGGGDRMHISSAGAVTIPGALSKGSGTFNIDHPHPELTNTHNLRYSFTESPFADLYHCDEVQLVNGKATVNLDDYARMRRGTFDYLCRNVRVSCVVNGGCSDLTWTKVGDGEFTVTSKEKPDADVTWIVIGERKDAHMMDAAHEMTDSDGRIITEYEKPKHPTNHAEHFETQVHEVESDEPADDVETEETMHFLKGWYGYPMHAEAHGIELPKRKVITKTVVRAIAEVG